MRPQLLSMLGTFTLALTLGIGGCAASDSTAEAGEDNLTQGDAITLRNYVSHPRIVAIRDLTIAVDRANFTKKEIPGCDMQRTTFRDPQGKLRKVVEIGGEGNVMGTTTVYYDDNGKVRFVFDELSDLEATRPSQRRVYFDAEGKVFWDVIRFGTFPMKTPDDLSTDFSKAVDELPTEPYVLVPSHVNPGRDDGMPGCPE